MANWAAVRYSSDHIFDYIELARDYSIFRLTSLQSVISATVIRSNSWLFSASFSPSARARLVCSEFAKLLPPVLFDNMFDYRMFLQFGQEVSAIV